MAECLTSYRKSQCVAGPCWPSVPSPCVGVMAGHEDPAVRQQQPVTAGHEIIPHDQDKEEQVS